MVPTPAKEIVIHGVTSLGKTFRPSDWAELQDHDVMAWDFCMNFARDNELQLSEGKPDPEA